MISMGTFGPNVFDDDSACDALDDLPDMVIDKLVETFKSVLNSEYVDYDEGQEVLAYSMVVLGLINVQNIVKRLDKQVSSLYTERLLKIIERNKHPWTTIDQLSIIDDCRECLKKIKEPQISEISELWHEGDWSEDWLTVVDGIIDDLN